MNAKTMEGLVGANINTKQISTPMRIYKAAERRGDIATMERAMGYVGEFSDRSQVYKTKADEGLEEDAREAREKAKLEREEAIRKRKEEREELEGMIAEGKDEGADTDTVEISEEGKLLVQYHAELDHAGSGKTKTDVTKESVLYTKSGEVVHTEQSSIRFFYPL